MNTTTEIVTEEVAADTDCENATLNIVYVHYSYQ